MNVDRRYFLKPSRSCKATYKTLHHVAVLAAVIKTQDRISPGKDLQAKLKADVVDIDVLWDRAEEEGGEYDDERTTCRHGLLHINLWSGRSCLRLGLCGGGANRGPSAFRCENRASSSRLPCPTPVLKIEIISHLVMYCTVILSFL